jgi:hypothetical protein
MEYAMSHPHSHRFLFLFTCLAALGFLLMFPSGVDAEEKRPLPSVNQMTTNARESCTDLGGTFTVRGTANRAITECQYPDGDYSTCLITPTSVSCHSLEVDAQPEDEGDPRTFDPPDDAIQDTLAAPVGHRHSPA